MDSLRRVESRAHHLYVKIRLTLARFFLRLALPKDMIGLRAGRDKPVAVLPLGNVDLGILVFSCELIRLVFGAGCRLLPAFDVPVDIWDYERDILDADKLLVMLAEQDLFQKNSRVLALTELDITSKDFPLLYGYASLNKVRPVGVCSVNLLDFEDVPRWVAYGRFAKIIVHEIGHTFAISHCENKTCVMRDMKNVHIDDLGSDFCESCHLRIQLWDKVVPTPATVV